MNTVSVQLFSVTASYKLRVAPGCTGVPERAQFSSVFTNWEEETTMAVFIVVKEYHPVQPHASFMCL